MKTMIVTLMMMAGTALQAEAQAFYRNNVSESRQELIEPVETVFPNPATANTTVVLSYTPVEQVYVDLVDFNGNVRSTHVFAPGGRQLSFDVGELERGHYVIRIRERGRYLQSVRLEKG